MNQAFLLRVQSLRSQNPMGRGGCIFTGAEISKSGEVLDAKNYFVVKASGVQLGGATVQPGQWWMVTGSVEEYRRSLNGYVILERQLSATNASLSRPSGEHLICYIAESDDFKGIGMVKARKLWETFGQRLYKMLDEVDTEALSQVVTRDAAEQVCAAWALQGNAQTLQWLQQSGIDVRIGRKLIAYFGSNAQSKLEEDPYRLLSFSASWKKVDALAMERFGVRHDDSRRLLSAVEEALYRLFEDGHTRAPIQAVMSRLGSVLEAPSRKFALDALANGLTNGSFIIGDAGNLHPIGALIMERSIANAVEKRMCAEYASLVVTGRVDEIMESYQKTESIILNEEQRAAVHVANANPLALITGGAGVGKTTVLKALYRVYDESGTQIFQVALAGRAAKRMHEATGRPALTLAGFLKTVKEEQLGGRCAVVIDEASMVDIVTMHRLCEKLPDHVRLILAGDTAQLMPVGPGLVLHAFARASRVPKVELKIVKRYAGAIALAAQDVRAGVWPTLPEDVEAPISFLRCAVNEIAEFVVDVYEVDAANTQILSPKKNGLDGAQAINVACQRRFTRDGLPLTVYSDEFQCAAGTGFYLGDQILCTKNLWDWGLQNGSLGRLVKIEAEPQTLHDADGSEIGAAIGWILWDDGERRPLLQSMLEDLTLGFAVTVHKAQGSQWPRVIVVLTGSRMLDRTLIYTALTRAQKQVILVGDTAAARVAVERPPRADSRMVGLDDLLDERLSLIENEPA